MKAKSISQLIASAIMPLGLLIGGLTMAASTAPTTTKSSESYKHPNSKEMDAQYEKAMKNCNSLKDNLKDECEKEAKSTHEAAVTGSTPNKTRDAQPASENMTGTKSKGKDAFEQASGMKRDQPSGADRTPEMKQQQPHNSDIDEEVKGGASTSEAPK